MLFKLPFALNRELDFPRGNSPLLREPMRQDGSDSAVKKVEHPIVDALKAYPKLIDPVSQIIGFWPAELVPKLLEALKAKPALILRPRRKPLEPLKERHGAVIVLVEYYPGSGQPSSTIVLKRENKVKRPVTRLLLRLRSLERPWGAIRMETNLCTGGAVDASAKILRKLG
jgi:hypothetical protein